MTQKPIAKAVTFDTPGIIDMRALTTMGVNVKPNTSSPIGYFGTGLKYAIAVLVRNNIKVTLWQGTNKHTFHPKEITFRGEKLCMIEMRYKKNNHNRKTELPYTTQFGKNWELWQVFRELYSNTIDEGGHTSIVYEGDEHNPDDSITSIIVEGSDFVTEFLEREKTFLPEALRGKNDEFTGNIQYFLKPSKHVYYRGMRVMDLDKPSLLTYNILTELELTEDRTVKYAFKVEDKIRDHVISSTDPKFIETVLEAPVSAYETRFDYDNFVYTSPSTEFKTAVNKLHAANRLSSSSAKALADRYDTNKVIEAKYPWLVDLMADHSQHGDWATFMDVLSDYETDVTEILQDASELTL